MENAEGLALSSLPREVLAQTSFQPKERHKIWCHSLKMDFEVSHNFSHQISKPLLPASGESIILINQQEAEGRDGEA